MSVVDVQSRSVYNSVGQCGQVVEAAQSAMDAELQNFQVH